MTSKVTLTRKNYPAGKVVHDDYYNQFATQPMIDYVINKIGKADIMNSDDVRFNDIPLKRWDALHNTIKSMVVVDKVVRATGSPSWSLSDSVCTAKVIARKWKDSQDV